MLKKFNDFDANEYKNRKVFENINSDSVEELGYGENLGYKESLVRDDKFLYKMSKVVFNALEKNGLGNYKPSTIAITLNGIKGVLFRNCKDINKCIVACRNGYKKVIVVFDNFEIGKSNKSVATYTSEKTGFMDMVKFAIEDLKSFEHVNESMGVWRSAAGYGLNVVNKIKSWPDDIKEFLVKLVDKNGGATTKGVPGKCANELLMNYHTDPMCKEIIDLIRGSKDIPKESTVRYYTACIVDALTKKYPEVEGIFDDSFETSTPVEKSVGDLYDVEEREKAKVEKERKRLEKANEVLNNRFKMIAIACDAYCKYVKNNGVVTDDMRRGMARRGMYISGKAGTGKSYTVKTVLKKNNMVAGKDYVILGNVPSMAPDLYKYCYKYNGKLIIFDDSSNMTEGTQRVSFWKQLLDKDGRDVDYPRSTKEDSDEFYNVDAKIKGKPMTRQQRYFEEIGKKTKQEEQDFITKFKKKELSKLPPRARVTDDEMQEIEANAYAAWQEESEKVKPRMPNKFKFTGCVIIIGNTSFDDLGRNIQNGGMSEEDWVAIQDRMYTFDITPPSESLWTNIQAVINEEREMSEEQLPSNDCLVPRKYIDDFINEVNKLLSGEEDEDGFEYKRMTWRIADTVGDVLKGTDSIDDFYWKEILKTSMKQTKKYK